MGCREVVVRGIADWQFAAGELSQQLRRRASFARRIGRNIRRRVTPAPRSKSWAPGFGPASVAAWSLYWDVRDGRCTGVADRLGAVWAQSVLCSW